MSGVGGPPSAEEAVESRYPLVVYEPLKVAPPPIEKDSHMGESTSAELTIPYTAIVR
jgi:hypothetical protein